MMAYPDYDDWPEEAEAPDRPEVETPTVYESWEYDQPDWVLLGPDGEPIVKHYRPFGFGRNP